MTAKADIRDRVDAFVTDLESLIRDAIRTRFMDAVGDAPAAPRRGRPPEKRASSPAPSRASGPSTGGKLALARRKKGAKRAPAELAKIEAALHAFIKATPGKRVEEINKSLGTKTSDLAGPLGKLVAKKRVRRKGQKRASRYFPAGK